MNKNCIWKKTDSNGYYDMWQTQCGKDIRIDAPEEVGMCFAPLPTDNDAKFCSYCGKEIKIEQTVHDIY